MNAIDRRSVQLVADLFNSKGYNAEITTDDKDPFDILLHTQKGIVAVEVKSRNCNHDAYPTMRLGYSKWANARDGLMKGTLITALVVCLYLDGWMGLGQIPHGHVTHSIGPLSTHFNPVIIQKTYWDVPFEALIQIVPNVAPR